MTGNDPLLTQDIVAAIRGGDRDAFDDLFTRVGGKVHVYIVARIGERLRAVVEPEDILQEVYLEGFGAFDRFVEDGRGSFARWLIGIARNQIRAHYKFHFEGQKRDANRVVPLGGPAREHEQTAASPEPVGPDETPSRIIARDEAVLKTAAALQALDDDERALVLEHVYEEKSLREIGEAQGVAHSTLAYRLGQSLDRMRAAMGTDA